MKVTVQRQEEYSRGALLLRSFFGWLYIYLPHGFLLMFAGLWGFILQLVAFWVILITGRYPENMFEYQAGLLKWNLRVSARMLNLSDGYPAFGIRTSETNSDIQVAFPEKVNRGLTLTRLLFGWFFVGIPHGFILSLRGLLVGMLVFLAWWAVLFTGLYPRMMHAWAVGQLRWQTRMALYLLFMTDDYPPFTGEELAEE